MRRNKNITRLVAWTLSGCVLTNSCINVSPDLEDGIIRTTKLEDIGVAAITIPISPEKAEYYHFLSTLVNEIIENPQYAKDFMASPQSYAQPRGLEFEITLDDELENIVKALADDEINAAIKSNDIKQYLLLLHKKGFLDVSSNEYNSILTLEEKKQILNSIGVDTSGLTEDIIVSAFVVAVAIAYVAGAVVSIAAVVYTAAAAFNLAVAATVYAWVSAKASGNTTIIQNDNNLNIWVLKRGDDEKYELSNDSLKSAVSGVISAYKEIYKEEFKKMDEEKLRQTLNLNILKQEAELQNGIIQAISNENI